MKSQNVTFLTKKAKIMLVGMIEIQKSSNFAENWQLWQKWS